MGLNEDGQVSLSDLAEIDYHQHLGRLFWLANYILPKFLLSLSISLEHWALERYTDVLTVLK